MTNIQGGTNQKQIDEYYTILDSLLGLELENEIKTLPRKRKDMGIATISISQNSEFAIDTSKNREQLCNLWDDYLNKYPVGFLRQWFQKRMLSCGKLRYKSLQDTIDKEFIKSNSIDLKVRGFTYLAENAYIKKEYSAAIVYSYPLLTLGDNKVGYTLLIAECNYLLGDIEQAIINAKAACEEASGRGKEPVCKIVACWLKDYNESLENKNINKKQHIFIDYY